MPYTHLAALSKRRSQLSIIAEVLEIAQKGTVKTRIMNKATLSYTQLIELLSLLLDRNLIETVKTTEKTTYRITDKGSRYLQQYRKILNLMKKEREYYLEEASSLHLINCGSRVIIVK